jgi:serine/threonine protein kinase
MSGIRGTIEFIGSQLLQPNVEKAPEDSAKVRAHRNSDGTVTLFATSRSTGLWGRLTGLSRERETARDMLANWVRQELGPGLSPEAKRVFREHLTSPELTFGKFRQIAADIEKFKDAKNEVDFRAGLRERKDETKILTLGWVDYKLGERLGGGSNGEVRIAEAQTDEKVKVAVKLEYEFEGDRLPGDLTHELDMHRWAVGNRMDAQPSHIVGLKGAVLEGESVRAIVTEHMAGGNVEELMRKIRLKAAEAPPSLTRNEVQALRRLILRDMATGLAQVHGIPSLIHRDVKPPNFLVNESGVVKIADFGTVQYGPALAGSATLAGRASPYYMAPETNVPAERIEELETTLNELRQLPHDAEANGERIRSQIGAAEALLSNIVVTQASDVFMLGMSALLIYSGSDRLDLAQKLKSAETPEDQRELIFRLYGVDGSVREEHALIRRMLSFDPDQRPTATEIAESLGGDIAELAETRALLARIVNEA